MGKLATLGGPARTRGWPSPRAPADVAGRGGAGPHHVLCGRAASLAGRRLPRGLMVGLLVACGALPLQLLGAAPQIWLPITSSTRGPTSRARAVRRGRGRTSSGQSSRSWAQGGCHALLAVWGKEGGGRVGLRWLGAVRVGRRSTSPAPTSGDLGGAAHHQIPPLIGARHLVCSVGGAGKVRRVPGRPNLAGCLCLSPWPPLVDLTG